MRAVFRAPIGRTCVTFLHADSNTLATTEIRSIEIRGRRCAHFRARSGYHREGGRTKRVYRPSVCALVAWRIHHWLPVVVAGLGMAGFSLTVTVVKFVVHRQRPELPYSVIAAHGYSFPSGHAMGVTTSALVSAWALHHWIIRSAGARIALWDGRDSHHCRRRVLPRIPRCALPQ